MSRPGPKRNSITVYDLYGVHCRSEVIMIRGPSAPWPATCAALPISRKLQWGSILINVTWLIRHWLFRHLTLAHGRYPVSENVRLFVMIGLCVGYTTFSSFSLQTLDLLRGGAILRGGINMVASVAVCVAAVAGGHIFAAQFERWRCAGCADCDRGRCLNEIPLPD
jgi:CrcB protein